MEKERDKEVKGEGETKKLPIHNSQKQNPDHGVEAPTNDTETEESDAQGFNDTPGETTDDDWEMVKTPPKKTWTELYTYTPLNFEKDEMRFLVLNGHPDGPGDVANDEVLECTFSFSPLAECEPYTYVANTRGNPLAMWFLSTGDTALYVTRNIVAFLNHIRSKEPQRLWFRDVCLDHKNPQEKARCWTPEWMDTMMKHAEKTIDLSEVMGELWDQGKLPKPFPQRRPKDWIYPREYSAPKHHPAPIESQLAPDVLFPHKYLPLDYVLDEFRLFTLWKADSYSDPIQGALSYTVMNDDTTYHCLSYARSDEEEATCPITMNGQSFLIRKNLDTFLRSIRHKENKYTIWIDDICINQSNEKERNRHLSRILEIYEGADAVLGWLGDGDESSDISMDFIPEFREYSPVLRHKEGEWDVKEPETFPRKVAALYRLFLRPYFRRIWVLQDISVASCLSIFCGSKRVSADDLDMCAYLLLDVLNLDPSMAGKMMEADPKLKSVSIREVTRIRRIFYMRHLQARGKETMFWYHVVADWLEIGEKDPGILDLTVMGRDFECTRPHDKAFALWPLARDTENMSFELDYSRDLADTWVDFATTVAQANGQLDIICAAEPVLRADLDIPSWCPDWSIPSTVSSLVRRETISNIKGPGIKNQGGPVYFAAGKGDLIPRFSFEGRTLKCAGIIADSVKVVGPYHEELGDQGIFIEWLNLGSQEFGIDDEKQEAYLSAFWSMLAGDVPGIWVAKEGDPITDSDGEVTIPVRTSCDKPDECRHFVKHTSSDVRAIITRGRRLIITESGKMGLAPHYVEVGQPLAVLNCCSVPVLLHENEDETYRFAGSCFLQGWMEGEVLEDFGGSAEEAWEGIDMSGRLTIV